MDKARLFWDVLSRDCAYDTAASAKTGKPILAGSKKGDELTQGVGRVPLYMICLGAKRNHGTKDSHVVPHHGTD